ncbi:MAG: GldG family protein [Gammaproteobacteria bacterium]|nr:GldG family protein [Gammaproteobacteria bacterium]
MKINRKTRLQLKLQSGLFVLLFVTFIGLLGWFSTQYKFSFDLTANQRNSLSEPTLRLLGSLQKPLKISAFISPVNDQKEILDTLFQRYQDQQALIEYSSINPDLVPERLREFNIQQDGEVVIEYEGRSENIRQLTESNVTNTIAGLLRQGERWVVFLAGHGERNPYGDANHDLQIFAARASQKGLHIETVKLTETPQLPDNTDILVIADASADLLPGEIKLITDYVKHGGNLLWLTEPTTGSNLDTLSELLEIEFLPGVIVDPSTQLLGLDRVDFALAADYPRHPVTTAIDSITLYPKARAIEFLGEHSEWLAEPVIRTHDRTWNETGKMSGKIMQGDDAAEQAGPLTIGLALSRSLQADDGKLLTQRIVVTGDSDFLSNQFVGNGSNLNLGLNMLNWLSHDDNLIAISPRQARDTQLNLSPNHQLFIAITFLILLPLLLLASGITIWLIRRKR